MGIIKCVVPGCEDRRSPRHRLPVFDQELYEEWLKRIRNKELLNLDPKFVGTNKRICSIHFSSHCRVPNSAKLKNRSLPTLHLPEFKEKPSEDNSILKYPYRTQTTSRAEHIRYIKDFKPDHEDGVEAKHLRPSVLSCPPSCDLPHFSSRCPSIGSPLSDTVTASDADSRTTVVPDAEPIDYSTESDDDQVGDSQPGTIDFTYLMKITSLPDTPLIEDSPMERQPLISESPPVIVSKSAADTFLHNSPHRASKHHASCTVGETVGAGHFFSFDLEELIREHCMDLHLVNTTSFS